MNAEDRQKSTTKMISIAMRYAEGTIDKDQVSKEKNLLGPEKWMRRRPSGFQN